MVCDDRLPGVPQAALQLENVRKGRSRQDFSSDDVRQLSRLLKLWVAEAGLDPKKYGKESLRQTKAIRILNGTGDVEPDRISSEYISASPQKELTRSQFREPLNSDEGCGN